jgi:hypothetical protein
MSAIWTSPTAGGNSEGRQASTDRLQAGSFLVQDGKIVAQTKPKAVTAKPAAVSQVGSGQAARVGQNPPPQNRVRPAAIPAAKPEEAAKLVAPGKGN